MEIKKMHVGVYGVVINDDKIVLIVHSEEQKEVIGKRFNDLLFYTFEYVTKKERKIEAILK